MKKGIVVFIGLVAALCAQAQDMYIYKTDGSITTVKLSDIEKITFVPDSAFVTDSEGNQYGTVTIGTQTWMSENLKVTKYTNGDVIDVSQWTYPNGNSANKADYGLLYLWSVAADSRGVCPTGWHTPSDAEWTVLDNYLGGISVSSGKLKETGTTHWETPNAGATNEVGFNSRPAGDRQGDGTISFFTQRAYYWTSTSNTSTYGWFRWHDYTTGSTVRDYYDARGHMAVRCVKN